MDKRKSVEWQRHGAVWEPYSVYHATVNGRACVVAQAPFSWSWAVRSADECTVWDSGTETDLRAAMEAAERSAAAAR